MKRERSSRLGYKDGKLHCKPISLLLTMSEICRHRKKRSSEPRSKQMWEPFIHQRLIKISETQLLSLTTGK